MTNGEKIKEIFPNIIKYGNILIDDTGALQKNILFDDSWWNAEYKEPTTKKDLGVDKTFYEQIMEYCKEHFLVLVEKDVWEDAKKALITKNDFAVDCINRADAIRVASGYCHPSNVAKELAKMPPVTPIRPKGHWIYKQRLLDSCSAECSACHNRSNGYVYDNGFSLECKYYDFCPKCGADMRDNTKRKGKPIEGNNESYNCENYIP